MDNAAVAELNQIFQCKPYRVQSSDAVPVSRPRLCWANTDLSLLPGVRLKDQPLWIEVLAENT